MRNETLLIWFKYVVLALAAGVVGGLAYKAVATDSSDGTVLTVILVLALVVMRGAVDEAFRKGRATNDHEENKSLGK